jgi:hypothetical protein
VSEHTFYRWPSKYGGMEVSDAAGHFILKMVTRAARRQAAGFLQADFEVSERRACSAIGRLHLMMRRKGALSAAAGTPPTRLAGFRCGVG